MIKKNSLAYGINLIPVTHIIILTFVELTILNTPSLDFQYHT